MVSDTDASRGYLRLICASALSRVKRPSIPPDYPELCYACFSALSRCSTAVDRCRVFRLEAHPCIMSLTKCPRISCSPRLTTVWWYQCSAPGNARDTGRTRLPKMRQRREGFCVKGSRLHDAGPTIVRPSSPNSTGAEFTSLEYCMESTRIWENVLLCLTPGLPLEKPGHLRILKTGLSRHSYSG